MKGLLLSLAIFAFYFANVLWLSRTRDVQRHAKLFASTFLFWTPLYFLAYALTPYNIYFLPENLVAHPWWLDAAFGFAVFALNVHTQADFFFTVNGGFSTGLLLELHRHRDRGLSHDDIMGRYASSEGTDKIYAWRLPRLVETGFLLHDKETGICRLTPKGRRVARLTATIKKLLFLGKGG